jgi:protein gp37
MAETSGISWTHATFNPWRGCTKVAPECAHCYADGVSKRNPSVLGIWGDNGKRVVAAPSYWKEPIKWNAAAAKGVCHDCAGKGKIKVEQQLIVAGVVDKVETTTTFAPCRTCKSTGKIGPHRRRVFCASMADVFEDHPAVWESRQRLWDLIAETPALDWLLLTKRPENVMGMVPMDWTQYGFPSNVWVGTSVEHQAAADERIPHLLGIPAAVRFLSCEPLLGRVELFRYDEDEGALRGPGVVVSGGMTVGTDDYPPEGYDDSYPGIDWVIVGGESGPKHRPMDLPAALDIIDQCKAAGISVYVKQDSGMYPGRQGRIPDAYWLHEYPRTAAPAGSGAPNADGGA